MQSVTKIAVASVAMLLLGSSASIAQPYGYGPGYGSGQGSDAYYRRCYAQPAPYSPPDCTSLRQRPDFEQFRTHAPNMTSFIIDPATGSPVTQDEYVARYPWTNLSTWSYNAGTNLWSDGTQQAQNYQGYPGYQPNGRYAQDRGQARGRDYAGNRDQQRQDYARNRDQHGRDYARNRDQQGRDYARQRDNQERDYQGDYNNR